MEPKGKKCTSPCSKIIKIQHGNRRLLNQAWSPSEHGALSPLHETGSPDKPEETRDFVLMVLNFWG